MWNSALGKISISIFQEFFLLVLTKFSFWEEEWAIILWHFEIFLIFSNFLISLSHSVTREATRTQYTMSITINHALFNLWWKKNLFKHQNVSKFNTMTVVHKRILKHLVKLAKWLSCVVSFYLYGAFNCVSLSCQIRVLEWIYTL